MPKRESRSIHRPFLLILRFPACVIEVATIIAINLLALAAQALWFILVVAPSTVLMIMVIACDRVDANRLLWLPRQREATKQFIFLPMHVKDTFVESLEKRMAAYVESQASL